mmetsp:Transcript_9828/g.59822  ORF Transcript_9828/g.59822 Transcript_9828/m.59822 type:complete len:240 (-) Transcript_9828:2978-3697(-)
MQRRVPEHAPVRLPGHPTSPGALHRCTEGRAGHARDPSGGVQPRAGSVRELRGAARPGARQRGRARGGGATVGRPARSDVAAQVCFQRGREVRPTRERFPEADLDRRDAGRHGRERSVASDDEGPVCELRRPKDAGRLFGRAKGVPPGEDPCAFACPEEVHVRQAHRGTRGKACDEFRRKSRHRVLGTAGERSAWRAEYLWCFFFVAWCVRCQGLGELCPSRVEVRMCREGTGKGTGCG